MSAMPAGAGGSLHTVEALHRVRRIQSTKARVLLEQKQAEIRSLHAEVQRVRKRRDAIIQRGGGLELKDRMLLDARARMALEKDRQIRVLKLQAAILLDAYREARARSDAVEKLRDQRREERESLLDRRAEEAAGDTASWRAVQERERSGE